MTCLPHAYVPHALLQPQDAYGLEKLYAEEMCKHYTKDFGMECRVARFHNIYGPHGTWKGGREKAPAAFCRKVRASAHTHVNIAVIRTHVHTHTHIAM